MQDQEIGIVLVATRLVLKHSYGFECITNKIGVAPIVCRQSAFQDYHFIVLNVGFAGPGFVDPANGR